MTPELQEHVGNTPLVLWEQFEKQMLDESTQRFIGGNDPDKALAFFAEQKAIRSVVGLFKLESEKRKVKIK